HAPIDRQLDKSSRMFHSPSSVPPFKGLPLPLGDPLREPRGSLREPQEGRGEGAPSANDQSATIAIARGSACISAQAARVHARSGSSVHAIVRRSPASAFK